MKFRTEIEVACIPGIVSHSHSIVMLGSCFTDNVGEQLDHDGFKVSHNPFGPLYNPASIHKLIWRACGDNRLTADQLVLTPDGIWHCLDFASRYSDQSADALVGRINAELDALADTLQSAGTLIITLGTAYVYALLPGDTIVGNCHKLPASNFIRYSLDTPRIEQYLTSIDAMLPASISNVIVTVSPIRHTADGLHGNQLSKAALLLAVDNALRSLPRWSYFPAYEIMLDDLRDYRFYASDMKHPSEVAVDYIYEQFRRAYFTADTAAKASECRKLWLRSRHRPILNN